MAGRKGHNATDRAKQFLLQKTSGPQGDTLGYQSLTRSIPVLVLAAGIFMAGIVAGLLLMKAGIAQRAWRGVAGATTRLPAEATGATRVFPLESLDTTLTAVELVRIPVGAFAGGGGAIAAVDGQVLYATPQGRLGILQPAATGSGYELRHVGAAVPMNRAGLQDSPLVRDPQFNASYFRTLGMLAVRRADGRFGLYVSHHRYAAGCIEFVVSGARLTATPGGIDVDGTSWEDLFVAEPCIRAKASGHPFAGHESGGRLARTAENTVLVTIGDHEFDGFNDPQKASMDPRSQLGKAIEINLDTRQATIFASGLRNPQGLVVSSDGLIWETEHGPHGGDELNVLQRGQNYGWPEVSYGVNYGFPSRPWPANANQGRHAGYAEPAFAFLPSIGISNLIETDSDEFPFWKGDLLVASLKDTALWRLRRNADRIVYSERIPLGERLRDIQSLPGGQLVLLTDKANLIIVRRGGERAPGDAATEPGIAVTGYDVISKALADESLMPVNPGSGRESGLELFNARCAGCHSLAGGSGIGPPLRGVVGRDIGSVEGYAYSEALARAEGAWTRERLLDFLSDPGGSFPGTTMPEVILPYRSYQPVVDFLETAD